MTKGFAAMEANAVSRAWDELFEMLLSSGVLTAEEAVDARRDPEEYIIAALEEAERIKQELSITKQKLAELNAALARGEKNRHALGDFVQDIADVAGMQPDAVQALLSKGVKETYN